MRMAREARGFSAALYFICDETGFERPAPRNVEDERAKLQRAVVAAVADAKSLVEKLDRLTQAPLQAVR